MSQNVGTLISAAIRPNDSLDPIASAFASEIKGGLHTASTLSDRNNIIFERREWGMMCYVVSDNKTYRLDYNYVSTNIMDNNNWKEFSGSGSGGGGEWIDSVKSIQNAEPISPTNGDRYIVGPAPTGGVSWTSLTSGLVVQWNSTLNIWETTTPTDGMSVRVDDFDNAIYKYEGTFPLGSWTTEKLNMVRNVSFTGNGASYSASSTPPFDSYTQDLIFLSSFDSTNSGTAVSLTVNGLGHRPLRKSSVNGLVNLQAGDLKPGVVYSIMYDGSNFQMSNPANDSLFNVKRYVEVSDYIIVPQHYQYWVWGDLEIVGTLVNYGHVVIANGSLILTGGTFSNYGDFAMVSLTTGSLGPSFSDTTTIGFTTSNTIYGLSVSAYVKDGSLTASQLDTASNGGATAGYLLSVDSSGKFSWTQVDTTTGATNGLDVDYTGKVVLGGTLSNNTQINGDSYDFTIGNANSITFTSSTINVNTTGNISMISTGGEIIVEGNSGLITISDGEGLVYSQDYSATFVTHSLVDKSYVDSQMASAGSITGISAGTGLTGGGTAGNINVSLDYDVIVGNGLTYSGGVISVSSGSAQPEYSQRNLTPTTTIEGLNFQSTGIVISYTPNDYSNVNVVLNGQIQYLGDGVNSTASNVDCYFSSDSGLTAKSIFNISSGDELYWNGFNSGFPLHITDRIDIIYEK